MGKKKKQKGLTEFVVYLLFPFVSFFTFIQFSFFFGVFYLHNQIFQKNKRNEICTGREKEILIEQKNVEGTYFLMQFVGP